MSQDVDEAEHGDKNSDAGAGARGVLDPDRVHEGGVRSREPDVQEAVAAVGRRDARMDKWAQQTSERAF